MSSCKAWDLSQTNVSTARDVVEQDEMSRLRVLLAAGAGFSSDVYQDIAMRPSVPRTPSVRCTPRLVDHRSPAPSPTSTLTSTGDGLVDERLMNGAIAGRPRRRAAARRKIPACGARRPWRIRASRVTISRRRRRSPRSSPSPSHHVRNPFVLQVYSVRGVHRLYQNMYGGCQLRPGADGDRALAALCNQVALVHWHSSYECSRCPIFHEPPACSSQISYLSDQFFMRVWHGEGGQGSRASRCNNESVCKMSK